MLKKILLAAMVLTIAAITVPAAMADGHENEEEAVAPSYCLNGEDVTLPAPVSAAQGSRDLTEGIANTIIEDTGGGFFFGYSEELERLVFLISSDVNDAVEFLEPGWSANFVALGACAGPAFVPMPARVGVCSPQLMMRGDGSMGVFHEIPIAQWLDPESPYHGFPAAKFSKGGPLPSGITCDNRPGYTATGRLVDGVGGQGGGDGQVYAEYVFNG